MGSGAVLQETSRLLDNTPCAPGALHNGHADQEWLYRYSWLLSDEARQGSLTDHNKRPRSPSRGGVARAPGGALPGWISPTQPAPHTQLRSARRASTSAAIHQSVLSKHSSQWSPTSLKVQSRHPAGSTQLSGAPAAAPCASAPTQEDSEEALSWVAAWGRLAASQGCAVSCDSGSASPRQASPYGPTRSLSPSPPLDSRRALALSPAYSCHTMDVGTCSLRPTHRRRLKYEQYEQPSRRAPLSPFVDAAAAATLSPAAQPAAADPYGSPALLEGSQSPQWVWERRPCDLAANPAALRELMTEPATIPDGWSTSELPHCLPAPPAIAAPAPAAATFRPLAPSPPLLLQTGSGSTPVLPLLLGSRGGTPVPPVECLDDAQLALLDAALADVQPSPHSFACTWL